MLYLDSDHAAMADITKQEKIEKEEQVYLFSRLRDDPTYADTYLRYVDSIMGNLWAKSTESGDANLSSYFESLYNEKLMFKRNVLEVNDITESVFEMVHKISNTIGEFEKRFNVSQVRFVGSMMEGTRNKEPDEFDFQLVIEGLSMTNDVTLLRECKDNTGHAYVEIKEDTFLSDVWKDISDNRKLKSSETGWFSSGGFRERFEDVLTKAVNFLNQQSITKPTGSLYINNTDITRHGPACLVEFMWKPRKKWWSIFSKNLRISVDVTPAIEMGDIRSIISEEEVCNPMIYKYLQATGVFSLIPCGKSTACQSVSCFRLAFTNTELIMMNELSKHHKTCLQILKYLFTRDGQVNSIKDYLTNNVHVQTSNSIFHSYSLKTLVLKHEMQQSCCASADLADCVLEIIEDITDCLNMGIRHWTCFEVSIPSIVLPSQNVFARMISLDMLSENEKGLAKIKKNIEGQASSHLHGSWKFKVFAKMMGHIEDKCKETSDKIRRCKLIVFLFCGAIVYIYFLFRQYKDKEENIFLS